MEKLARTIRWNSGRGSSPCDIPSAWGVHLGDYFSAAWKITCKITPAYRYFERFSCATKHQNTMGTSYDEFSDGVGVAFANPRFLGLAEVYEVQVPSSPSTSSPSFGTNRRGHQIGSSPGQRRLLDASTSEIFRPADQILRTSSGRRRVVVSAGAEQLGPGRNQGSTYDVPSARLTLHSTKLCTKFKIVRKKFFCY
jgi:hypothetical protein